MDSYSNTNERVANNMTPTDDKAYAYPSALGKHGIVVSGGVAPAHRAFRHGDRPEADVVVHRLRRGALQVLVLGRHRGPVLGVDELLVQGGRAAGHAEITRRQVTIVVQTLHDEEGAFLEIGCALFVFELIITTTTRTTTR
jgi:hypothetical protein